MPKKIRELRRSLNRAGFALRPGKGSHTVWTHPRYHGRVVVSGNDGDDAKPYQESAVRDALAEIGEEP